MNKKSLIAVVGGLVALGGAAFFVVGSAAVPGSDQGPKPGSDAYYTSEVMEHPVEGLLVNLAGARSQTYLELSILVRYRTGPGVKSPEGVFAAQDAKVRDRLNILLSNKTVADLEGSEKKQALKHEIRRALDEAIFPDQAGRVEEIFYSKFSVQ